MRKSSLTSFLLLTAFVSFSQSIKLLNNGNAYIHLQTSRTSGTTQVIPLKFELKGPQPEDNETITFSFDKEFPLVIDPGTITLTLDKSLWPSTDTETRIISRNINMKIGDVQKATKNASDIKDFTVELFISSAATATVTTSKEHQLIYYSLSRKQFDTSNQLKTDFSFYTDFLGADNDRPNGLYQLDLGFKVPTKKYRTLLENRHGDPVTIQLFRSFYANINASHLDNLLKEDFISVGARPVTKTDSSVQLGTDTLVTNNPNGASDTAFKPIYAKRKMINGFDLYQWASFSAKIQVNILALRFANHKVYLYWNLGLFRTPVYDSVANQRLHVTSFYNGPGAYYETDFKIGEPLFNFRANTNLYWLTLRNNDLEQVAGPVFRYNTSSPDINTYKKTNTTTVADASFRLAYIYGRNETSQGNQFFLRVAYGLEGPKVEGTKFRNGFTQVQFGAQFDINRLIRGVPTSPGSATISGSDGSSPQN